MDAINTIFKNSYTCLKEQDKEIYDCISRECRRQDDVIQLIASENTAWPAVLEAQGSVLTNKYAEGHPGRRYYGGCNVVDEVEVLAQERLKKLFDCEYANVQPHSGSSANIAVLLAFLKPGDTLLGMDLSSGGHLTHGSSVSISGKFFNSVSYGVDKETHLIDYDNVYDLAQQHKPKLIIAGFSAYSRNLDWRKFRKIADSVGAILICDIAHIAGLIAGGALESPIDYADVVTSTTHKTLRGPRGGVIFAKTTKYAKKIDSTLFPGIQGGPLMHVIAAKAVAFGMALKEDFKDYVKNVIANAAVLADGMQEEGLNLLTGGTDNHLIVANLTGMGVNGVEVCKLLEEVGIVANQNSIPYDVLPPSQASGLRVGSPATTVRGCGAKEFKKIGQIIGNLVQLSSKHGLSSTQLNDAKQEAKVQVKSIIEEFPLY